MFIKYAFLLIALLVFASGCTGRSSSASDERRGDVELLLDRTERFLQDENEAKIKQFFSRDYYGGYDDIERRLERAWGSQQILNLEININRILEQDGLFNVQVTWNKTYLTAKGKTGKSSGTSEITLVPHRDTFRILHLTGDNFF